MRIALFSDIHANLPALEAVLQDMETQEPDAVYCLGDLVGYAPWPNEVTETIKGRGIPTIAGNYDQGIGNNSDDCGCAYKTDEEKANGAVSIKFTNETITPENRTYLHSLPAHLRLEFGVNGSPFNLLLVHGSPRKINEYLFEDRPDKSFANMMNKSEAGIMAFGHTHKPFHKAIENGDGYLHAINIGSVGKPKDGDPRACYVLLDIDDQPDFKRADGISVHFRRVEYEVEKAATAVEQSPLPDVYADNLRKAY